MAIPLRDSNLVLNKRITALYRTAPERYKTFDFWRVFVEVGGSVILELTSFANLQEITVHSLSEIADISLERIGIGAADQDVTGAIIKSIMVASGGESVLVLSDGRLLWMTEDEGGTVLNVVRGDEWSEYSASFLPYRYAPLPTK